MKHLTALIALFSAFSVLLTGCLNSPTFTVESPLLTPGWVFTSLQPTPGSSPFLALPTPSSAEVATVGGILVRDLGNQGSEFMANATVYLASVIRSDDGTAMMAVVRETSPKAMTDENGIFIFTDVLPDTYGLAIATPIGSFLIQDETGGDFLFTVQAGEVLDLGEIRTTLPY